MQWTPPAPLLKNVGRLHFRSKVASPQLKSSFILYKASPFQSRANRSTVSDLKGKNEYEASCAPREMNKNGMVRTKI